MQRRDTVEIRRLQDNVSRPQRDRQTGPDKTQDVLYNIDESPAAYIRRMRGGATCDISRIHTAAHRRERKREEI